MTEYLIETAEKGGVVLIPLFLISIGAWYLLLVKWDRLRKEKYPMRNDQVRDILNGFQSAEAGKLEKAISSYKGLYREAVLLIHQNRDRSEQWIRNALKQMMLEKWPNVEEHFNTIAVCAALAPLLGLLGTVSGMINTFKIITLFGSGNPVLMAGGISEALLTTQSGLVTAFPILIFLTMLRNKTQNLKNHTEGTITSLINLNYYSNNDNEVTRRRHETHEKESKR